MFRIVTSLIIFRFALRRMKDPIVTIQFSFEFKRRTRGIQNFPEGNPYKGALYLGDAYDGCGR